MKRREIIGAMVLLGGAAFAAPFRALAQTGNLKKVGVLAGFREQDSESQKRLAAFRKRLNEFGWTEGRNLQIEFRFAGGDVPLMHSYASELVAMSPDVILAHSNPGLVAARAATRTVPIVFVQVADPVGGGFVESLSRPGGNATGFTNFEPSMGGKWLDTLHEISPSVRRVLVLLHPETAANVALLRVAEAAAGPRGIALTPAGVHDRAEIERAIAAFVAEPGGAMIVLPHVVTGAHRDLIVGLATEHRLPTIYPLRSVMGNDGLMAYGIDVVAVFARAAEYVDRILRGAKPGELPVQAPDKFELAINLKTAKALGLAIPPALLARADEVIE